MSMSAAAVFDKYADNNGFISLEVLKEIGWSKAKAEDEGLIIRENYKYNGGEEIERKYKKRGY